MALNDLNAHSFCLLSLSWFTYCIRKWHRLAEYSESKIDTIVQRPWGFNHGLLCHSIAPRSTEVLKELVVVARNSIQQRKEEFEYATQVLRLIEGTRSLRGLERKTLLTLRSLSDSKYQVLPKQ